MGCADSLDQAGGLAKPHLWLLKSCVGELYSLHQDFLEAGDVVRRDHQPDILFGGDALLHARHHALATVDFLSHVIALELAALSREPDPARRGRGRAWIIAAQSERRRARVRALRYGLRLAVRRPGGSIKRIADQ